MRSDWRIMGRQTGAALAVLAVYLLVLLLPLHQAAGLQRDLAGLGYDSLADWSVCAPLAEDADDEPRAAALACPLAGLGKHELAAPLPAIVRLLPPPAADPLRHAPGGRASASALPDQVG